MPSSQFAFQNASRFILHAVIVTIIALGLCLTAPTSAHAAAKRAYAGIVIDAKTGKTLYSHAADAQRYPASVTKVMTLYIVFQELEAGRLSLSTRMRVSKHAANAVPTKLGLRAGKTIKVEDAIKALVTLSANDISRVIAEHISGSESKFAERMTKTARALGMNRTTYKNASGLPNSGQVTTVRDQARLGVAVYQHFPKYYKYFQIRGFKYGKRTYGNHNRLLGQNGIDGIKTGYIRASGYNLLTAARKNNRHIVVVAFGFDSGAKRNGKVAALVNKYLPKARKGTYTAQAQIARPSGKGGIITGNPFRVASANVVPMPRLASRMPEPIAVATVAAPITPPAPVQPIPAQPAPTVQLAALPEPVNLTAPAPLQRPVDLVPATAEQATNLLAAPPKSTSRRQPQPETRPIDIVGAWINKNLRLGPETGANGAILPPANIQSAPPAPTRSSGTLDLLTSGAATPRSVDVWMVQIGAAHSEKAALDLLADASRRIGGLKNYRPFVETISKNGQTFHRARFAGFGDRQQAGKMCEQLKQNNMSCLAMQG